MFRMGNVDYYMTRKIPDTMKYDVQSVKCNKRKGFIKDYYKFISDTKIELMLHFDGSMSDNVKQVQSVMKILFDKGFNGSVQCCNGEYYSDSFRLGTTIDITNIEKCDNR